MSVEVARIIFIVCQFVVWLMGYWIGYGRGKKAGREAQAATSPSTPKPGGPYRSVEASDGSTPAAPKPSVKPTRNKGPREKCPACGRGGGMSRTTAPGTNFAVIKTEYCDGDPAVGCEKAPHLHSLCNWCECRWIDDCVENFGAPSVDGASAAQ